MNDKHTYVKITRDDNGYGYEVTITKTGISNSIFGSKNINEAQKVPFIFKTLEIAKDFVSVLPDIIEKVNIKAYRCQVCHLCFASYETYKLIIGNYEAYIKWHETNNISKGFLSDKHYMKSPDKLVDYFVASIKPDNYKGHDVTTKCNRVYLSELVNVFKENDSHNQKEEYNFELVQQ